MPAINKTSLGLNQWLGNEYPKRIDFVEDNKIIDEDIYLYTIEHIEKKNPHIGFSTRRHNKRHF